MSQTVGVWEKVRELGAGGFGVVSLWKNNINDQTLALKMCRDGFEVTKIKESWSNEVEIMKKLNHPNIIKVVELPDQLRVLSNLPILCMEFCQRGDLRKELFRTENICGLPEEKVRAVLKDIMSAIVYLHSKKIAHRDLKPENIVMQQVFYNDPSNPSSPSTKIVYKLIDLGFAKEWDQNSLCSTLVGTPQYIAPELFTTNSTTYKRSVDYWSFGLVCHEIITGYRPFLPYSPLPFWVEMVKKKKHDHICVHENIDGTVDYRREIFPENHLTQELKYDLENWLRLALEWDGGKRGRNPLDNSLIIFSVLEKALVKKIITVYCISKLEQLSYHIDDSTQVSTLKQWIERDTNISCASQTLLLPSGDTLDNLDSPVLPHVDTDPKLVAMLYVISKEEGVQLPEVELFQSKHPVLVRALLESPSHSMPYYIVRRTWANSVYFIQSILDSYRAFIETYSVKLLSLIDYSSVKLSAIQTRVSLTLHRIEDKLALSQQSLSIDLENIKSNHFTHLFSGQELELTTKEWKSKYSTFKDDYQSLKVAFEKYFPHINKTQLDIREMSNENYEPGLTHIDSITKLLIEGRKMHGELIRMPSEAKESFQDASPMVDVIFSLWQVIADISNDEQFKLHLSKLHEIDTEVMQLLGLISAIEKHVEKLQDKINREHLSRQKYIWNLVKRGADEREYIEIPPSLPRRNPQQQHRVPLDDNFQKPLHI